ncbi:hypothetical protein, partial [Brytella acorum]
LELCRIPFPRNLAHKTRPRSGQMIAYRPVRKMGTTSFCHHLMTRFSKLHRLRVTIEENG